jgi:uncharacterized membrane-anchored protein
MSAFSRPLPKLVAVVALQVFILFSVIAFKQYTVWTSETVLLRLDTPSPQSLVGRTTMPIELDISRLNTSELPGDNEFNKYAYVELQEGTDGVWEPVAIHDHRSHSFEDTVLIRGEVWNVYGTFSRSTYELHYGVEDVFIPEGTSVPSGSGHTVALEVRVDRFGDAVPRRFVVDGEPLDLERR